MINLKNLCIRSTFGGELDEELTGTLAARKKCFRYKTMGNRERVDILYSNIKHAFFQPAKNEMITLLHLHLHEPIMFRTKETIDVQFYVEVIIIGPGKKSFLHPRLQWERGQDNKKFINEEFKNFVEQVHQLWESRFKNLGLEFEQPLREIGFFGTPYNYSSLIVPTSSCFVELVEARFFVITLAEIEIVNFERVGLHQKENFDLAFIFKDLKRDVVKIDLIPYSSIHGLKEWLYSKNVKFYESRVVVKWRPILEKRAADPNKFVEGGGWEVLDRGSK